MVEEIPGGLSAHGIENHVDAFTPRELRSRNKVAIARHKDDLIHQSLVRHCSHIQAQPHIDAFLNNVDLEIVVRWVKLTAREPPPQRIGFWTP